MAKVRDIQRTAAFAWSPNTEPFVATGTQAGAVSADFSDNTQLELWDLDLQNESSSVELAPVASVNTDSKFYDIAWGHATNDKPRGIIAGALENGSLDLWSADSLLEKSSDPLISRTTKHTGAIKSLQFNPFKSELLATAGAKGELYVWDLNNTENPFMLGNRVARADDYDCLDWNKKVSQILVTGGNGGFLTVWDVRTKKESLTLNNLGRKPVSAVSWHPEQQTKLITAIPDDTNPVILLWDLRNSNAPERTLTGHTSGVLSLSWCKQDVDLLLSSGKDNRTICWNPQTGDMLGEFPVVTNWTFKTSFNSRNPGYFATASYDGKIVVRTLQNTNPESSADKTNAATADGDDFFSRASNAQTSSFSLKQPPKWLRRPTGATFGFGGKLVSYTTPPVTAGQRAQSKVQISTVAVESSVNLATEEFEKALKEGNLVAVCDQRAQDAKSEAEKAEWKVLRTLFENNTKEKLVEHLGFKTDDDEPEVSKVPEQEESTPKEEEKGAEEEKTNGVTERDRRLSSFFADGEGDSENFLADLSSVKSTKGARTNNPFQIYTSDESEADVKITRAVLRGNFEKAVDICLKEDRVSDAFMLAICGGDKCTEKVKTAYFTKKAKGPNYLRILASIVGKNLWDVVYNADLANWKEVVATLCTFADHNDYPDLCETLGDRLEEEYRQGKGGVDVRSAASLCYLAGAKLDKVVAIWVEELHEAEKAGLEETSDDSTFSVHARSLQNFIEKVTVFRQAVKYVDADKNLPSGWKLDALYSKYCEYADIVASQGQLQVAAKYLDLLPAEYPAATVARNRIKEASSQSTTAAAQARKPQVPVGGGFAAQPFQPAVQQTAPAAPKPYAPQTTAAPANPYAPPQATTTASNMYTPAGAGGYKPNPYQPPQTQHSTYQPPGYPGQPQATYMAPPPPRQFSPAGSMQAPSKQSGTTNWNDIPDLGKPLRRSTPSAPQPATSPFPGAPPMGGVASPPQPGTPFAGPPPRATPPPPPKNAAPPQRVSSPASQQYRPQSPALASGHFASSSPQQRYAATPIQGPPPSSGRYTPQAAVPGSGAPGQGIPPPPQGTFPGRARVGSGPQYAPPPTGFAPPPAASPYAPAPQQTAPGPYAPPQAGPGPYAPPPANQPPPARPGSQPIAAGPPPKAQTPAPAKYPPGDRTHIPDQHKPIFDILSAEIEKVKANAPPQYQRPVKDTEKRLNILFDHMNNEEVLSQDTLQSLETLAKAIASRDYATAHGIQVDLVTNKTSECDTWMTGVKRLIEMSKAVSG